MMRCDVAVVGAGPIGSTTARLLAERGYKTVVLEKRRHSGDKVCGGLVSQRFADRAKTESVVHDITGADIVFPNGRCIRIGGDHSRACVIDRDIFDRECAECAMAEGVQYLFSYPVCEISAGRVRGKESVEFEMLVGADGARSAVAGYCRAPPMSYINAIQGMSRVGGKDEVVRVFLDAKGIPGFFAWCIPDGTATRVGLGSTGKGLRTRFFSFTSRHNIEASDIRGALIPMGLRWSRMKDAVLLGDAAGQVKATSGGGLYGGLLAAHLFAETFPDIPAYRRRFMKAFGREIKRSLLARSLFVKLDNDDFNRLAAYAEKNVTLINRYGDIDYQSAVARACAWRHPWLAWFALTKLFEGYHGKTTFL